MQHNPETIFPDTLDHALALDRDDPLARFRERFHIPAHRDGSDAIYLCGNSLGLQPRSARGMIAQELDDWAALGVEGHFHAAHPWLSYHELLTAQTARLAGALPGEVVVMNSLTVNLHLMLVSFYRPTAQRNAILIEHMAFPSDQYAVDSQIRHHGYDPEQARIDVAPREGEHCLRTADILERIDREAGRIALVLLGGVNYYTGQLMDMRAIAAAARRHGIAVGFDLAHAAGNVPLALHDWDADFAVWCSYKYLNAGPGAVAGCFVHERHARRAELPRFAGWWGHDKESRFRMGPDFRAIPGAEGWQLSNAPILSMAPLRASMDIFDEAGMTAIRAKSDALTGYLLSLLLRRPHPVWTVLTPADPAQRGAQLSLHVARNGRAVFQRLAEQGVICDWREPDVIRVAPAPLYNSFADAQRFAALFHDSVEQCCG
ncbi:MAG: kynureninase [Ignavibacteria bacterium]|nr:kynureninase [Ignavibacteria bacterium]